MVCQPYQNEGRQETLLQALGALAYRQFVLFLVLWLTIGMPIDCQWHGIMTLFDVELHAGHTQSVEKKPVPDDSSLCSAGEHQSGSGFSMNWAGIGIIPVKLVLLVPIQETDVVSLPIRYPSQRVEPPPTPPPRLA